MDLHGRQGNKNKERKEAHKENVETKVRDARVKESEKTESTSQMNEFVLHIGPNTIKTGTKMRKKEHENIDIKPIKHLK